MFISPLFFSWKNPTFVLSKSIVNKGNGYQKPISIKILTISFCKKCYDHYSRLASLFGHTYELAIRKTARSFNTSCYMWESGIEIWKDLFFISKINLRFRLLMTLELILTETYIFYLSIPICYRCRYVYALRMSQAGSFETHNRAS